MIQYRSPNITVFESALFRTTSTVVQTPDLVMVVDPNWLPEEIRKIRQFVDTVKKGRPVYLLFTHSDYDHIIGYGAFPEAQVIASKAFAHNPDKQKIVDQILDWDGEYYISRKYPIKFPEVNRLIEGDGEELIVGSTSLIFYQAPGHNPDGLFTIVPSVNLWIAGDYLSNVEFPYIYHSIHGYKETLQKAREIIGKYEPGLLICGHGDVALSLEEMLNRIEDSDLYIEELEKRTLAGEEFPEEWWWNKYPYPRGMRSFHAGNLTLARKELNK